MNRRVGRALLNDNGKRGVSKGAHCERRGCDGRTGAAEEERPGLWEA